MTVVISGTAGIQNVLGSAAAPAESNTTSSNTGVYFPTSTTLGFSTAGTNAVYIDASQNVGIGVTPSAWISSSQALQNQAGALFTVGTSSIRLFQNSYFNTSSQNIYVTTAAASGYIQSAGAHQWFNAPSGTAGTAATFTQAMTLDSSGNLLVGTTTADAKLCVVGTSATTFFVKSSGTTAATFVTVMRDSASNNLLYIRSDGYINTGTSTNSPYNLSTSGRAGYLDSSGGFGYLASIRAAKTNIESLSTVSWVYNLNPVQFNYRKKNELNQFIDDFNVEKHYGLIAEEVESINKELCFYDADGTLRGVSYDKLTSVLLKAIQEQQALITSLTDRIAALEAR
jgi:hypothetical protein